MRSNMRWIISVLIPIAVVSVTVGCGGEEDAATSAPAVATAKKPPKYKPKEGVDAGLPPDKPKMPEGQIQQMAKNVNIPPRSNPFMLMPEEVGYEAEQKAYRFFDQIGGFTAMIGTPPSTEGEEEQLVYEAQPYRRLSGVLVGDSVYAIVESAGGRGDIVRPGQKLSGTDWVVVSIDEEKAILRRDGNKLPKEIIVRLESPPANARGNQNNQNNQNQNNPNNLNPNQRRGQFLDQLGRGRRPGFAPGQGDN